MADTFPEYVTDGYHIYLWHEEYADMLQRGVLKECEAPPPAAVPKLTPEEEKRVEEMRQKALEDARLAIKAYGPPEKTLPPKQTPMPQKTMEDIFGSPPKTKKV